jgi:hypothetical protein
MSTDPKGSSGTTPAPGGNKENDPSVAPIVETRPDTVKYDTYQKVLNEKKRRDEELTETRQKLDALETEKKTRDEQELHAKGELKKLLDIRDKELADSKAKYSNLHTTLETGVKRGSFLNAVNGIVDEQYYSLIDLSQVVIDPATGMPDELSVQKAARDFESKYPLVIKRTSGNGLPNDAAKGGSTSLTYDEWLKLPTKEQKARMKEVIK